MAHPLSPDDLRTLTERAPFMIAVVDGTGRILWTNREVARVLARAPDDLVGTMFADACGLEAGDREHAARLLESGEGSPVAIRVRRADRTFADARWWAIRLADGHVALVARDASEERALSARLARAERLEAIGRLAGGIAHDFNNLLTVIGGNAQLLVELRGLTGPADEEAREIVQAVDTARAVIRQLLTFTGRAPQPVHAVDINQHVDNLREIVDRLIDPTVQIDFELAPGVPPVMLEEGQIEQVVINLLLNARDAMPDGGRVRVRTDVTTIGPAGADLRGGRLAPGDYVTLVVSDTGRGMDAAMQERIFEPFFTTREESGGTGLGLATVHSIVRHAGGSVDLASAPGEGATFTIHLPVATAEAASQETMAMPPAVPPASILVVDDHDAVRTLCRRALENDGHTVMEAAGSEAALGLARQAGRLDLIVLDCRLGGEGGRDLLHAIRDACPGVRALLISGHSRPRGYDGPFLDKPFMPAALVAAVRTVLGETGR